MNRSELFERRPLPLSVSEICPRQTAGPSVAEGRTHSLSAPGLPVGLPDKIFWVPSTA